MFYLYTITNIISGKVYVGQTVRPQQRWSQHKNYAKKENLIQYIHCAMAKYGVDNFVYEVVATCKTQEDADYIESLMIKQYDSRNKLKGYNLSPGGDVPWNKGLPPEQQPMYGKHHSEESKRKSSISNKGKKKPHSQEWSEKISSIMKGRQITWAQKLSESQTKFTVDIEREIVSKYKEGISVKILKEEYGCAERTIYDIIKRRRKYDN